MPWRFWPIFLPHPQGLLVQMVMAYQQ